MYRNFRSKNFYIFLVIWMTIVEEWMTIVESGWNVWVWLVGVMSSRRVWLVGEGGIYGCGCKEVYRFPHTTYPYSSCICSFLQLYIIESVDSISRDERDAPLTQYITNAGITSARYAITYFKHHHRVLWLISNRLSV